VSVHRVVYREPEDDEWETLGAALLCHDCFVAGEADERFAYAEILSQAHAAQCIGYGSCCFICECRLERHT